jgi:hypothetical protein
VYAYDIGQTKRYDQHEEIGNHKDKAIEFSVFRRHLWLLLYHFSVTLRIMKPTRIEKVYITLLMVIFGGIVLHAPLSVGLGTLFPDHGLLIKSWKEVIMALAFPLAIGIIVRRGLFTQLLNDLLVRLIALFAALHLLLASVFYQGLSATAAGLAIDLRYLLFFFLVYVAILVFPEYRRRMLQIGVVGAFVVTGFAVAQLFLPADILTHIGYGKSTIAPYLTVDKNPNFIRENSTLRGPNPLGAYAGMVLGILAAAWVRRANKVSQNQRIAWVVLVICSLVALWVSYSRSAWIAGIIAVVTPLAVFANRKMTRRTWAIAVAIVVVFTGATALSKDNSFVSNVILHENPTGGSAVSSNEGHVSSLVTSWGQFIHQPFGSGVGSTGSASLFSGTPEIIENQYLFVAHEAGWLGLGLFAAIFIIILMRLWHRRQDWLALGVFAGGIGIASIGLLLPVWTDDTVSIVWWGLAAIALGEINERSRNKTK